MIRHLTQLVLLMTLFYSCSQPSDSHNLVTKEINTNWNYRQVDGELSGKATVPGTIHTDLLKEGKIEDPFYRTNEKEQQWIDKEDWEYSCTFNLSDEEISKENLILDFKGLDTYADVYVNDQLLLQADNMFREWEVDIREIAKTGENQLRIYFHSPIQKGLELLEKQGYGFPANNDQSENGELGDKKVSVFTRKAGYHYGWDWGPRFVTSGLWRPVYLKAWDSARIKDTYIQQNNISEAKAELIAAITVDASATLSGKLIVLDKESGKQLAQKSVEITSGNNNIEIPFSIVQPKLWWSSGLGEAHLYTFQTQLVVDNKIISNTEISTGLRELKVIREKDAEGESFVFQLNGVKVFAKGANYIPNDNFLPRVTHEQYEKVVADAVNSNMNMLRVWGGGIYENNEFYDLCDKNGIMIWQDFMFACSMYPGQPEFLANIKQEAIDNVVRLRNHPSIALWCGNNEINTAWSYGTNGGWGWKQQYTDDQVETLQQTYVSIFHEILPNVVQDYTVNDFYWPSSPQAGYDVEQHAGYESTSGDMHYWGVWHGLHRFEDFEKYRARFMSEYGFQSFPDFETVQTYTLPEDYDIESEVMAAHQRSGIGNLRIREYMSWYFNIPSNFEDELYMGQVLQAYGMRMGMEAHRRAMPFCMGTLFWQINDCWPVASWSSTDYYHKWKAMQYATKRAYEKTILSAYINDGAINIYGISDELKDLNGELKLQVLKFDGTLLDEKIITASVLKNTSTKLFESKDMLAGWDASELVLNMQLLSADTLITENLFYFVLPKDLKLASPSFKHQFIEKDGKNYIEIESDQVARYVYLNVPGQNEFFADNYFDLLPNQKRSIEVTDFDPQISSNIEIKHLQMIK
ncbi:MAG: glycoside hydrolase family 2 protein [Prolixibacteraceae bacterium]